MGIVVVPEEFLGVVCAADAEDLVEAGEEKAGLVLPLLLQQVGDFDGLTLLLVGDGLSEAVATFDLREFLRDLL